MSKGYVLQEFIRKSVLPVCLAIALYYIFKPACMKDGSIDYTMLWICCGLPFGWHGISMAQLPGGTLGGGLAMFTLRFVLAGVVGGLVLIWKLLVAAFYIPITIYRLVAK